MLEAGRISPLGARECVKGTVVGVEDVNLVVAVRLGKEDTEIRVDEIEIDRLVGDLED